MFDAIIVGRVARDRPRNAARPKGIQGPARRQHGFPAILVDPLHPSARGRQAAPMGLLEKVAASGCPPIERQIFDVGPFALNGCPPPADGDRTRALRPADMILDRSARCAAVQAGVEVPRALLGQGVDQRRRVRDGAFAADRRAAVWCARLLASLSVPMACVRRSRGWWGARVQRSAASSCAYYSYWSDVRSKLWSSTLDRSAC